MGKCVGCGLVQVVPMPTVREIAKLYDEDFEHFEPYFDQEVVHHAYFKKKIEEIIRKIPDQVGNDKKCLLDIGCLTGILLDEAKKVGMNVAGVDISHDAVTVCKKKGFAMYEGTIQSLGNKIHPNSFNIITAFQVIEHERDPLNTVKRIYKLLKKDGLIVMATPNYSGLWQKIMGKRWFGFAHPEHVVLFDFKTMKLLLEKAGFKDIEVKNDSPRPFPLSFAFTRGADYFPWAAWILKPLGKFFDHFNLKNPINPWDDMIVFGKK